MVLQRCGLGQSELIQTGLFLPKICSRHRQGKGGGAHPPHQLTDWRMQ